MSEPLIGAVVVLPGPEKNRALVLDVEHEYDDGTTLRYLTGRWAGSTTMRDTYAVRRWERVHGGNIDFCPTCGSALDWIGQGMDELACRNYCDLSAVIEAERDAAREKRRAFLRRIGLRGRT